MNTDDYDDYLIDGPGVDGLPADDLVLAFVADHARRAMSSSHVVNCPEMTAKDARLTSSHYCSEGTCYYDPAVAAVLSCPHGFRPVTHTIMCDTMAQMLDEIHAFAQRRNTPHAE